jgi:enamine deaminase RidA (YjgF/YER057c/UK114 family)
MADTRRRRVSSPSVHEPPPGTFSRAIQVGNQLFVAGMTANNPNGIEGGDSMAGQTHAVFTKIKALVEAAGGTMNDIVKMTGFITDISRRDEYLKARQPFFTTDPPASTLVEITALAAPGLIIEVEVMAIIGCSGTRGSGAPRLRRGATKARGSGGRAPRRKK